MWNLECWANGYNAIIFKFKHLNICLEFIKFVIGCYHQYSLKFSLEISFLQNKYLQSARDENIIQKIGHLSVNFNNTNIIKAVSLKKA